MILKFIFIEADVPVVQRPRVGLLITGDEVLPPGSAPAETFQPAPAGVSDGFFDAENDRVGSVDVEPADPGESVLKVGLAGDVGHEQHVSVVGGAPAPEDLASEVRNLASDYYDQPVRVRLLTRIAVEAEAGAAAEKDEP